MAVEQLGQGEQSARTSTSTKQDADAASETSSVHSGDASDRRDADILAQVSSTMKSEEYRLLFRLPPDEVLVQDFNCAFQENILLQGHMYLFVHHVCFYSNIFGFETKKTIPFHEFTCVRKAKTAAIFPNAIEIVAGLKKYFFGSFLSRDEAYRLIIDGWAQHSSEVKAFVDRLEVKSDVTTQDNGFVMLDRLRASNHSSEGSPSPDRNTDVNILEECKPMLNSKNDPNTSEKLSEVLENGGENSSSPGEPLNWQSVDVDAPKIPEYFTVVAEAKFPVIVEEFFNLFISDSASEFLQDFHRKCGDKDFQCTLWRKDESGHARDVSFSHPVNIYIGSTFGRCHEVQKFRVYRNSHLVIETSQQISDVPFGDCFQVEGIWDVVCDNDEEYGCIVRVYSNVAFSKRTFFKGKIEQSTRDECREVYATWVNMAQKLLQQKNAAKPEGLASQITGLIQDTCVEPESSSKLEGPLEILHQGVTSSKIPQILPYVKNLHAHIEIPMQEILRYFLCLASTLRESWDTSILYLKSQRQSSLLLPVAFAAVIILMQVSIIILLTRVPQVHVVTQGNYFSSPASNTLENIVWLEKRFNYLKEEMFMIETRMERMHHEYSYLKAHLQNLDRLKPEP